MSSFAASELCTPEDGLVLELGPNSYNTGHRVFYSPMRPDPHPARVVVDRHSADQQLLTALEFPGADVQLLPAMSGQILRLLADGQADAAVWTIDEMEARRPIGILDRPLSASARGAIGDRDTRTALVGRAADVEVLRAVTASIDGDSIARIQADVMAGRIVPEY
jgi:hypothetical protein